MSSNLYLIRKSLALNHRLPGNVTLLGVGAADATQNPSSSSTS